MPKENTKRPELKNENKEVTINLKKSSIAEFTKRPLPSEDEMNAFEEKVEKEIYDSDFNENEFEDEEKDEEIEESLNEIYQEDDGHMADVKKMHKIKRHGFLFRFFLFLIFLGFLGGGAYYSYNFLYLDAGSDATALEFSIEAETEVVSGEEFFYTLKYKNTGNISVNNLEIEAKFPDNFLFLDSFPAALNENNNEWKIDHLAGGASESVKIKGMLLGEEGDTSILLSSLRYTPENFQSEFKKEASLTIAIKDIGLNIDFDYLGSVLVGDSHEILINFNSREKNFINNFRLTLEPAENLEILKIKSDQENLADFEELRPGVWDINQISETMSFLPLNFIISEKQADKQKIILKFEQLGGENYYTFLRKEIELEVMKSDLNLTLIINGSRDDQGVDFDDTLNYSIVYKNKGETEMKDVIIMAVLKSDFLDWTSLEDSNNGSERGNTISWSKNEIESLKSVNPNAEGSIDFSIKLLGLGDFSRDKEYKIVSYAQFSIGSPSVEASEDREGSSEPLEENDNKSNTIINKINSDLKLNETLRYFNSDNIPVGTGPHPPKVGEETTYKIYWDLENNLHELKDLEVKVSLPEYVFWDAHERTTAGSVKFNEEENEIVWNIGRLPITVFQANAEFSIKIKPREEDKNKIMVLLPGSEVSAIDAETEAELEINTKAKTTKLEDDNIAQGDGIVN